MPPFLLCFGRHLVGAVLHFRPALEPSLTDASEDCTQSQ